MLCSKINLTHPLCAKQNVFICVCSVLLSDLSCPTPTPPTTIIRYFILFSSCAFYTCFFLPQCEPGLGASVMYNLLYNKPQKLMLLAGCSTVCTTVAEAAKMWNLIVVSI